MTSIIRNSVICPSSAEEENESMGLSEKNLGSCALFEGKYNWGLYDRIDLSIPLTNKNRVRAFRRMYEVCGSFLDLKPSDAFLEIGCGDGIDGIGFVLLTEKFSLKNASTIDLCTLSISEHKKCSPSNSFKQQDVRQRVSDSSFNKILCVESTQNILDMQEFLRNIHSSLQEGGIFVFSTFFRKITDSLGKVKNEIQTVKDGINHLHYIENIKEYLNDLYFSYEVIPIGENVFPGYDKWASQTSAHDSWTRNLVNAYTQGAIDYFVIVAKKLSPKTPIDELRENYKNGMLEKYQYIRQMNKINKSLFYLSKGLKDTDISKIEISDDLLIFTTRKDKLKIQFSGRDRRGAPFDILNFGSYEEEDEYILSKIIQNGDIIFDVGANIGWYSLLFSKRFSNSKIFCFEPLQCTFEWLQKNIKLNVAKNIKAFNFGFGEKNGFEDFYFFPEGSVLASQKNLLDCEKAKPIKCEIKTLDYFMEEAGVNKIDFLKCDVEGGEFSVLKGGKNSLSKFLPVVFIELYHRWSHQFGYHPNEVILNLKELGYECYYPQRDFLEKIENLDKEPEIERLNYIFLHAEKHKKIISSLSNEVSEGRK